MVLILNLKNVEDTRRGVILILYDIMFGIFFFRSNDARNLKVSDVG